MKRNTKRALKLLAGFYLLVLIGVALAPLASATERSAIYSDATEHFNAEKRKRKLYGFEFRRREKRSGCLHVCTRTSHSIAYTDYKYFTPKLSVIGGALTLSFGVKF